MKLVFFLSSPSLGFRNSEESHPVKSPSVLRGQKHGEGTLQKADGSSYSGGWSQVRMKMEIDGAGIWSSLILWGKSKECGDIYCFASKAVMKILQGVKPT